MKLHNLLTATGATDAQRVLLGLLYEHEELTQKRLCEITGKSKSSLSLLLSDLSRKGMISERGTGAGRTGSKHYRLANIAA